MSSYSVEKKEISISTVTIEFLFLFFFVTIITDGTL